MTNSSADFFENVDHKVVFVWIPSLAPQITLKSLN